MRSAGNALSKRSNMANKFFREEEFLRGEGFLKEEDFLNSHTHARGMRVYIYEKHMWIEKLIEIEDQAASGKHSRRIKESSIK
jgi:hypothetical protein